MRKKNRMKTCNYLQANRNNVTNSKKQGHRNIMKNIHKLKARERDLRFDINKKKTSEAKKQNKEL